MAVRVYIECDLRRPNCHSRKGKRDQPQGYGISVVTAHGKAEREASEKGWHKSADGVFCPSCWPIVGKLKANGKL